MQSLESLLPLARRPVRIEPLGKAVLFVQLTAIDERRSREARGAHRFDGRHETVFDRNRVLRCFVNRRVQRVEDRLVGDRGRGSLRDDVVEHDGLRCEFREMRRGGLIGIVRSQDVGTQRVDGEKDHSPRRGRFCPILVQAQATPESASDRRGDRQESHDRETAEERSWVPKRSTLANRSVWRESA